MLHAYFINSGMEYESTYLFYLFFCFFVLKFSWFFFFFFFIFPNYLGSFLQ